MEYMEFKSPREEKLKREGWKRRFVASEPRLSEAVELYESLGLEVKLEPIDIDALEDGCKDCFMRDDTCKVIYTRPKNAEGEGE